MTNKEYKRARENAENAPELEQFETYHYNYFGGYTSRYMKPEDIKELRKEYKELKKEKKAFALDGFGGRALVIPMESGDVVLQSYYTAVAVIRNGNFIKLWDGYSNTTLKHINEFRRHYNMSALSKREWIELN